jgi:hypothetical protein
LRGSNGAPPCLSCESDAPRAGCRLGRIAYRRCRHAGQRLLSPSAKRRCAAAGAPAQRCVPARWRRHSGQRDCFRSSGGKPRLHPEHNLSTGPTRQKVGRQQGKPPSPFVSSDAAHRYFPFGRAGFGFGRCTTFGPGEPGITFTGNPLPALEWPSHSPPNQPDTRMPTAPFASSKRGSGWGRLGSRRAFSSTPAASLRIDLTNREKSNDSTVPWTPGR